MARSRYDMMDASHQREEVSREVFPDVLTAPYHRFYFEESPREITLTRGLIDAPYFITYNEYGYVDFDDIILNINGIPFTVDVEPGDYMKLPSKNNMERFYNKNFKE